jgi:hypothetical protein
MQMVPKDMGYESNDRIKVAQHRDYFGALVKK